MRNILLLLLMGGVMNQQVTSAKGQELWVYFGTYSERESQGVYLSRLDLATGKLSPPAVAAKLTNPSFLALHPTGKFLYAVGEINELDGKPAGGVSALAIDDTSGVLTLLNQQSSRGAGPCHVAVDPSGKNALVANYGGGSVACLPIEPDGRIRAASAFVQHTGSSVNPNRQAGPHAHSIHVDATGKFAIAADLGLDKLLVYRFDASAGTLTPNEPPSVSVAPGGGPRHFDFHPTGKFAYANHEMTSAVSAFQWDAARGVLTELHALSTLPEGVAGNENSTAECRVHPSGRFVYVSNRGHNSIAIFRVDEATGRLTPSGHASTQGAIPRNFNITPDGRYLLAANQDSDNVVVFRVDAASGALEPTGSSVSVPMPVCVRFRAR